VNSEAAEDNVKQACRSKTRAKAAETEENTREKASSDQREQASVKELA